MSHITTLDLEIKDLDCMQSAAEALGGIFDREAKTYQAYYESPACNGAITFHDAKFGVGLIANEDGSYRIATDLYYTGGLQKHVGEDCGKLLQSYAEQVTRKQLSMAGYHSINAVTQDDGTRILQFA